MIFERLKKIAGRQYLPLNLLEISRKKLINNFKHLATFDKRIKIAPVLKSNAYGHGIVEVARLLDPFNPPFFCVDSLFEAYKLYKANIKSKILIMGYVNPENLKFKTLPFSYSVYDLNQLTQILKYQPRAGIHIFVDTGMHREGIMMEDLNFIISQIPRMCLKNIEGLMSHFGAAEKPKIKETIQQVKNFRKALETFKANGIIFKWRHIANSAGLLNSKILGIEKITNMARTGILLYESVLRFITHVNQIKRIKKGEKVGYDFTYTSKKALNIAILPAGYNDGIDRILSNKGKVLIRGIECPIIGRVSMNITTIDISQIKNLKVGQEVEVLFNPQINGRIPYEFFIHLNAEMKRIVVD